MCNVCARKFAIKIKNYLQTKIVFRKSQHLLQEHNHSTMESKYVVYLPSSFHTEHDHLNLLNISFYMINFIHLLDICTSKDMIIQGRFMISPKHTQSGAHFNYHETTIYK